MDKPIRDPAGVCNLHIPAICTAYNTSHFLVQLYSILFVLWLTKTTLALHRMIMMFASYKSLVRPEKDLVN